MARIKIALPEQFHFTTTIPIRITDMNYGGHVGNDAILSLIHEARVQFLRHHGFSELDLAGVSLIMGDAAIEFRSELFYGDSLRASVAAGDFSRVGFDLFYKFEKQDPPQNQDGIGQAPDGKRWITAVLAKTGMVCFDYSQKKPVAVPAEAKAKLGP